MSDIREKYLYRSTHCWSCKQDIDTVTCAVCPACGWIICNRCSACCGPDYGRCFGTAVEDPYERIRIRNEWVKEGKPNVFIPQFVREYRENEKRRRRSEHDAIINDIKSRFEPGSLVEHKKFGYGVVIDIYSDSCFDYCVVHFGKNGDKSFLVNESIVNYFKF